MRILYYDCFSGLSGDMNLAAMIDLGVTKEFLISELKKLPVEGYTIEVTRDKRNGIEGTKVTVNLEENSNSHKSQHHFHRNLKTISDLITNSTLNDNVKKLGISIFENIAKAEAKVHGTTIDKIHFHEVGAVDSIVDIVGAAICYNHLKVDKIICSTIELGGGFVICKHGKIPIPAPATVEILRGIPTKKGTADFETTTPTGAAILATITNEFSDKTEFVIEKVGYGIGHKKSEIPNAVRVYLGDINETFDKSDSLIIECNIDDMNPELFDHVIEKLFELGADDVYLTPIQMKKNRPATMLSVLCSPSIENNIVETILTETSSLGIRKYPVSKIMLKREFKTISTQFGNVTIKYGIYNGKTIKSKPEYNDCKRIANENNISIQDVYTIINAKILKQKGLL